MPEEKKKKRRAKSLLEPKNTAKKKVVKKKVVKKSSSSKKIMKKTTPSKKAEAKRPLTSSVSKDENSNYTLLSDQNIFKQIQERAYELYLERGQQNGSDQDDWLIAEQEVRKQLSK